MTWKDKIIEMNISQGGMFKNTEIMETHSSRHYKVVMVLSDGNTIELELHLEELMKGNPNSNGSDFEYVYAMQSVMDGILDLKLEEMLSFKINRDVPEEGIGVIVRTH